MLQNIRNNVQGVAAKVIIGFIAIPFVFFGVDSLFSGSPDKPVALVDGEEILDFDLQRAINMQKRQLLAMMGENADPTILEDSLLRGPALESLIREKLMLAQAEELKLATGDKQLNSVIVAMPQFQDGGRFSNDRYLDVLRSQGYTGSMFKQLLASDIKKAQLRAAYAGTAFLAPQQKTLAVKLTEQRRSFNYLTITADALAEKATASDEEVQAYYQNNPQLFQRPEEVKISYVEVKLSDLFEEIDEETLRAEYDKEVAAMSISTSRRAAHILVELDDDTDRAQATAKLAEAKAKLAEGESFASVAKSYSEDVGTASFGGELGITDGSTFPEPLEEALASIGEGEVSDVVETDFGLHIVKLVEVIETEVPSYESRKDSLAKSLQSQKARPALLRKVEQLRDLSFNSEGLAGPAKELGLKLQTSGWIEAGSPTGILANQDLREAAFNPETREQKLNSEVVELDENRYAVLHVEDYRAASLKPFDTVQAEVTSIVKREKGAALAKTAAADAQAQLNEGKTIEQIAESLGVEWQAVVLESRSSSSAPAPVKNLAFKMPRPADGSFAVDHTESGKNSYVVRLSAVVDGDLENMDSEQKQLAMRRIQNSQSAQSFSAFYTSLKSDSNIKIN